MAAKKNISRSLKYQSEVCIVHIVKLRTYLRATLDMVAPNKKYNVNLPKQFPLSALGRNF